MSANTNVPTEYTDVVAVGVSAVAAQASRSEASSGDEGDFQESAKKKFYFTIEKDLDLLREILSARLYAAKHGTVTTRYHDVATNLNEYWGTELAMRTVKERFFLLVKEFKSSDIEYRKKSGVAEDYTEIKQCLQDITDEMRDLAELKMKKKSDKKSKEDRLVSAGEQLCEQATKRRSSRESAVDEEKRGDSDSEGDLETARDNRNSSTSSSDGGIISAAGVTTAQVNAATVAFINRQSQRHDEPHALFSEELSLKQAHWKEELELRKREVDVNAQRWSEEAALCRGEIALRREELMVLKHQVGLLPLSNSSFRANV